MTSYYILISSSQLLLALPNPKLHQNVINGYLHSHITICKHVILTLHNTFTMSGLVLGITMTQIPKYSSTAPAPMM